MQSNPARNGHTPVAPGRRCVLVVEDEILIRMMLSEELRDAGYDVIEAVNADEAVAVLQSSAHVDVIVSDVRMPGSMDGIELLAFVKETFPTMPVIMTSGHLQAMADTEGATKFVAKPYFLEFMVKAVDDAMAKL